MIRAQKKKLGKYLYAKLMQSLLTKTKKQILICHSLDVIYLSLNFTSHKTFEITTKALDMQNELLRNRTSPNSP